MANVKETPKLKRIILIDVVNEKLRDTANAANVDLKAFKVHIFSGDVYATAFLVKFVSFYQL